MNTNEVYIFPDLQGANRFSGYNQAVPDPNDPTGSRKIIIVHINTSYLNNNFPEQSASTIIHELSHVIYDPGVLDAALAGFRRSIVDLLLQHPDIIAGRAGAADQAAVTEQQRQRLSQILYETVAYAEEELFVHMQQLTHQPDVSMIRPDGTQEDLRDAQLLERELLRYVQRLQALGLETRMLNGVLDMIGRRSDILFDRRIAAYPAGSTQRQRLDANKRMAQLIFEMARRGDTL